MTHMISLQDIGKLNNPFFSNETYFPRKTEIRYQSISLLISSTDTFFLIAESNHTLKHQTEKVHFVLVDNRFLDLHMIHVTRDRQMIRVIKWMMCNEMNTDEEHMMMKTCNYFIDQNQHSRIGKYRTKYDRQSPVHHHMSFDNIKRISIGKSVEMLSRWMDSKLNGDSPRHHYTKSNMRRHEWESMIGMSECAMTTEYTWVELLYMTF